MAPSGLVRNRFGIGDRRNPRHTVHSLASMTWFRRLLLLPKSQQSLHTSQYALGHAWLFGHRRVAHSRLVHLASGGLEPGLEWLHEFGFHVLPKSGVSPWFQEDDNLAGSWTAVGCYFTEAYWECCQVSGMYAPVAF